MKVKCCRSLPRCATCPVVLAARARAGASPAGDLFDVLRGAPPRELPACVLDALRTLEDRRLARTESVVPATR
jgi:hypothetical protein